jgi:hypothetical protein
MAAGAAGGHGSHRRTRACPRAHGRRRPARARALPRAAGARPHPRRSTSPPRPDQARTRRPSPSPPPRGTLDFAIRGETKRPAGRHRVAARKLNGPAADAPSHPVAAPVARPEIPRTIIVGMIEIPVLIRADHRTAPSAPSAALGHDLRIQRTPPLVRPAIAPITGPRHPQTPPLRPTLGAQGEKCCSPGQSRTHNVGGCPPGLVVVSRALTTPRPRGAGARASCPRPVPAAPVWATGRSHHPARLRGARRRPRSRRCLEA